MLFSDKGCQFHFSPWLPLTEVDMGRVLVWLAKEPSEETIPNSMITVKEFLRFKGSTWLNDSVRIS